MSIPILPLAVWEPGTNQNSIPANDNALRLQLLNGLIISDAVTAQPGSPTNGDAYIMAPGKTGTQWALFDVDDLAIFMDGTWYAYAPVDGIVVNVAGDLATWDGSAGFVPIGGGGGGVTSVDAANGVEVAAGTPITATGTIRGSQVVNAQTGTSYALAASDRGKRVTLSNAASIAATIAQAGTTGFENGYYTLVQAIGVGAVTLTPTTSTINGAATLVLDSGMSAMVFSDGTNYRALVFDAAGVAVNAQTGTSYTYLSGDRGKLVTHSNGSAIAGTLPQATGAFGAGWFMYVQNRGAGTLTITPTTSTIDGAASLALATDQGVLIASDGTNYFTLRGLSAGGGGGLTGFTSALNTASPNNTVNASSVIPSGGTTNQDGVFGQKGTGAIIAQIPNAATSQGNKRGANAVDWQTLRFSAARVASGTGSVIGGGSDNASTGSDSVVPGGTGNTASGQDSYAMGSTQTASAQQACATHGQNCLADGVASRVGGRYAQARGIACVDVLSSQRFSSDGDAQAGRLVQMRATSGTTAATLGSNNAAASSANTFVLPNTSAYYVKGRVVVRENATGDCAGFDISVLIRRGANAAATAVVGSPSSTQVFADAGATTWTIVASADTTLGALILTATGQTAKNLKWTSILETVEVVG